MSVLSQRVPARPIFGVHPGLILAALDIAGLLIASYLAVVEVGGGVPACGPIAGCEEVALSDYSRIGGIPVAVFGVILSVVLLPMRAIPIGGKTAYDMGNSWQLSAAAAGCGPAVS